MRKLIIYKTAIIVLSIMGNIMAFPVNDIKDTSISNEDKNSQESYSNLQNLPVSESRIEDKIRIPPSYKKSETQSGSNNESSSKKAVSDTSSTETGFNKANSSERGNKNNVTDKEDTSHFKETTTDNNNSVNKNTTINNKNNNGNSNNNDDSNNNNNISNTIPNTISNMSKDLNLESYVSSNSNSKNTPQTINSKNNLSNTNSDENIDDDSSNKKSNSSKSIDKNKKSNNKLDDTNIEKDTTFDIISDKSEDANFNEIEYNIDNSSENEQKNKGSGARRVIYVSGVLMGVVLFFIVGNFVLKINVIEDEETRTEKTMSLDLESFDSIQLRAGDLDSLLSLETMEQYSKDSEAYVINDANKKKNIAKIYEIKRFKDVIFRAPSNVFKNDSLFGVSMDESSVSSRSVPSYQNSS